MVEATNLVASVPERPYVTSAWWAVVARFLIHGLIVSTWVSRIPAVQSALGLSNATLGLCLLGAAIGSLIAAPLTGWLVTRFGSRQATTWSTIGFTLALLGPSFAINGTTLFCALILFGLMGGMNDISMNSQGVAVESALKLPTMSRFHAMFSVGGMIGAAIGGVLAAHEVPVRMHLGLASALLLILSLSTSRYLFEADDQVAKRSQKLILRRVPPVLIALAVIGFCMFLSEGAMADWGAVYLKQILSAGPGLAAAGYAVFSVGMAIFRLLGDSITTRLGPVTTVRAGGLLAAVGLSMALLATSPYWALPGFALTGVGFSTIVPIVFGAGGRQPSIPSGAGVALVSGSGYIAFLFGPPIIGLVAQWSSLRFALLIVVALSLVAAGLANAARSTQE